MAIQRYKKTFIKNSNSLEHKPIYPPYFPNGVKLFILSGLFIAMYSFSFSSISGTSNYVESVCSIKSIDIIRVDVDCKNSDGSVFIHNMPCVLIYVDTNDSYHVKLFRNYEEKAWVLENEVNCSYLPYSCQDSPDYVHRMLTKSYKKHLPEEIEPFECYTILNFNGSSNSSDALMYIPNIKAYYFSVSMLALGLLGGILLIFFRIKFKTSCMLIQPKYRRFRKDIDTLNYDSNDPKFNFQDYYHDEEDEAATTLSSSSSCYSVEINHLSVARNYNNNQTLSENVSRNLEAEDVEKMMYLGFRVNRIGYAPSCSRTSVNTSLSNLSKRTTNDENVPPPVNDTS